MPDAAVPLRQREQRGHPAKCPLSTNSSLRRRGFARSLPGLHDRSSLVVVEAHEHVHQADVGGSSHRRRSSRAGRRTSSTRRSRDRLGFRRRGATWARRQADDAGRHLRQPTGSRVRIRPRRERLGSKPERWDPVHARDCASCRRPRHVMRCGKRVSRSASDSAVGLPHRLVANSSSASTSGRVSPTAGSMSRRNAAAERWAAQAVTSTPIRSSTHAKLRSPT
jgi:hypothetical protein